MQSNMNLIGNVVFPSFTKERLYQIPFKKNTPLPNKLSRWQSTVDDMLEGIDTDEEMYLMVDQGYVEEDTTQRRGAPHIDGNWNAITGYGGGSQGYKTMAWDTGGGGGWNTKNLTTGGIILATSCDGAKVYTGSVDGIVGEGGDCSHLDLSNMDTEVMECNKAYIGNVTMIHEAMSAKKSGNRTLVRITLPSTYVA